MFSPFIMQGGDEDVTSRLLGFLVRHQKEIFHSPQELVSEVQKERKAKMKLKVSLLSNAQIMYYLDSFNLNCTTLGCSFFFLDFPHPLYYYFVIFFFKSRCINLVLFSILYFVFCNCAAMK